MKIAQIETAIDSFHAHHNKSAVQHQIILDFLANARRYSNVDFSINELSQLMGWRHSTLSARLNEMLKSKQLVECEHRKDRYSNVMCRPVALGTKQLELFH